MEVTTSNLLFVYSSLREGFRTSDYNYISKYFSFVCNAKVKGILNDMGTQPVATPFAGNNFIKGELYKLNTEEEFYWAFAQLDDYEGLNTERNLHPLYRREITTVYKEDGTVAQAWVYWYNGDVSGKPVITSGDVLEYLKNLKRR